MPILSSSNPFLALSSDFCIGRLYQTVWPNCIDSSASKKLYFCRHLKYLGGCTIPLFQLRVWCEKLVAARHFTVIWKQLLIPNDRNRVRWVVLAFRPLTGWGLHRFVWKLQREQLKWDQSNYLTLHQIQPCTKFNPPLFSLVNTFNRHIF